MSIAIFKATHWTYLVAAYLSAAAINVNAGTICAGSGSCTTFDRPPPAESVEIIAGPSLPPVFRVGLLQIIPQPTLEGWHYAFSPTEIPKAFSLPYFGDLQISAVISPSGWNFEIAPEDIFALGHGAGYMRWIYDGSTTVANQALLFGFNSAFQPSLSTYRITLIDLSTLDVSGYIPLSPTAIAAGLTAAPSAVPEPSTFASMMLGLVALGIVALHKKSASAIDGQYEYFQISII
ncbi:MAG: PEP-CTERM sorting domain-containing protein [Azonexus sp.]|nr:PEP-CTERM sorting domain-containing protein [Azonexus sp.]